MTYETTQSLLQEGTIHIQKLKKSDKMLRVIHEYVESRNLIMDEVFEKTARLCLSEWDLNFLTRLQDTIAGDTGTASKYSLTAKTVCNMLEEVSIYNPSDCNLLRLLIKLYISNVLKSLNAITQYYSYLAVLETDINAEIPNDILSCIKRFGPEQCKRDLEVFREYLIIESEEEYIPNDIVLLKSILELEDSYAIELILTNIEVLSKTDIFSVLDAKTPEEFEKAIRNIETISAERNETISAIEDIELLLSRIERKSDKKLPKLDITTVSIKVLADAIITETITPELVKASEVKNVVNTGEF